MTDLFAKSSAVLSDCGRYRYLLTRGWDEALDAALFVMLNPSTADDDADDPTIRRCVGFARSWGYGGLRVVNLYALRATDPAELRSADAPVGPQNDTWIFDEACRAVTAGGVVVCAWGAGSPFPSRAGAVWSLIRAAGARPHCLRVNSDGSPAHPLYLPKTMRPFPWGSP